jgi:hypothetical protein
MTCKDFRRLIRSDPRDATTAELVAVKSHAHSCPKCMVFHKARVRKAEREMSTIERIELEIEAAEFKAATLAKIVQDPELQ